MKFSRSIFTEKLSSFDLSSFQFWLYYTKVRSRLFPSSRKKTDFSWFLSKIFRYAVLQADFTLRKTKQGGCIAMEIKPKSGVIPSGRQSCRFCVTQLQKIRRGKYDARSAYCPVDLYSPYIRRKARFFEILKLKSNRSDFFSIIVT